MTIINNLQNNLNYSLPSVPAPKASEANNASDFNYWLELHKKWPAGTEFYPPTEEQGSSELGNQKNFYMIFPPGFPSDLILKLKNMFNDKNINKQKFDDMYTVTFDPVAPNAELPPWTANWRTELQLNIKNQEILLKSCNPECAKNIKSVNSLLSKLLD